MRSSLCGFITLFLSLSLAPNASAQEVSGPQITGLVGGSLFDSHVSPAGAVSVGYRFSELFAVEGGLEGVSSLQFSYRETGRLALFAAPTRNEGRALLVVATVVASLPIDLFGLKPYALAGGGMANLRQSLRFGAQGVESIDVDRSQTVPAASVGAGLEFALMRALSVGVDVRYLHLFSEPFLEDPQDPWGPPAPVNPIRFGTRIVYRF